MSIKRRVLYVGRFDVPALMERARAGQGPSNHVHALPDLEAHGYAVHGLQVGPKERASPWALQRMALKAVDSCDVIVAHAHYDVRGLALLRRAGMLKKPLFAFVHSHNVRPWHRAYLPGFDGLWPIGGVGHQRLLENGCSEARVARFPYGTDLGYYREALPWCNERPIVLSVGVSGRDFGTLIAAADKIQGDIHVVGKVSPEDVARAPKNVTFHSSGNYDLSFSDLLGLYARAACVAVVHHGTPHPFGITAIVEAMGLGRPIVATHSAGIDIDPQAKGIGYSVPAHDPASVAQAVNALLADTEAARRMGHAARRLAETEFNSARMAEVMAKSIDAACGRIAAGVRS